MTTSELVYLSFTAKPAPELVSWLALLASLWLGGLLLVAWGRLRATLILSGLVGLALWLPAVPELLRVLASPHTTLLDQVCPTAAAFPWVVDYTLVAASLAALAGVEGRRYGLHWAWMPAVVAAPGVAGPALLWKLHEIEHIERRPPRQAPDVRLVTGTLVAAGMTLATYSTRPPDGALSWDPLILDAMVTPLSTYIIWTLGQIGPAIIVWAIPRLGPSPRRLLILCLISLCVGAGTANIVAQFVRRHTPSAWEPARTMREYVPWTLAQGTVAVVIWWSLTLCFVSFSRLIVAQTPVELCAGARARRAEEIGPCEAALSSYAPEESVSAARQARAGIEGGASDLEIHGALLRLAEHPDLPRSCRDTASADWRVHALCPLVGR